VNSPISPKQGDSGAYARRLATALNSLLCLLPSDRELAHKPR